MGTERDTRNVNSLDRVLGPIMTMALVIGTIIGSGVFKKPAKVAEYVPTFGVAMTAWVVLATLIIFGGLALAEIAVLFPRTGGNYVFLGQAYGRPFGFMWGWMDFTVIRTASIAALAVIFAESLHDMLRQLEHKPEIFTYWQLHALAQGTILFLGLVNARGVRWGGGLQVLLTIIKVGGIIVMAFLPFGILRLIEGAPPPTTDNYLPIWPTPERPFLLAGFGAALIQVLWPFHGWQNIGPIAGEVSKPQRNIPISLIGGIGIVAALYLGLNFAYASVIPIDEMKTIEGTTTAAYFCTKLLGPVGGAMAAGVVMCSVFGALNGNVLVGPRLLFAMGEDGLAPKGLSAIHPRYRTPARAIMVYTIWSMILLAGGATAYRFAELRLRTFSAQTLKVSEEMLIEKLVTGMTWKDIARENKMNPDKFSDEVKEQLDQKITDPFDLLTDFAMFGAVIFETLTVASIYVFRWKLPDAPRPYRCPGYPVVPAIYILAFMGVLASYFVNPTLRWQCYSGVTFTLAGALVYFLFLRRK